MCDLDMFTVLKIIGIIGCIVAVIGFGYILFTTKDGGRW